MNLEEQTGTELVATPLYLYTETPLHAGVGFVGDGPVDLPIQREPVTGYPMMRSSTLKGTLRASFRAGAASEEVVALFGSEPTGAEETGQGVAQEKVAEQMGALSSATRNCCSSPWRRCSILLPGSPALTFWPGSSARCSAAASI